MNVFLLTVRVGDLDAVGLGVFAGHDAEGVEALVLDSAGGQGAYPGRRCGVE